VSRPKHLSSAIRPKNVLFPLHRGIAPRRPHICGFAIRSYQDWPGYPPTWMQKVGTKLMLLHLTECPEVFEVCETVRATFYNTKLLSFTVHCPFLAQSASRACVQQAWRAWTAPDAGGSCPEDSLRLANARQMPGRTWKSAGYESDPSRGVILGDYSWIAGSLRGSREGVAWHRALVRRLFAVPRGNTQRSGEHVLRIVTPPIVEGCVWVIARSSYKVLEWSLWCGVCAGTS